MGSEGNKEEQQEGEEEALVHGHVLEFIFTFVPLIDLVPASLVSKAWNFAVSSSLSRCNAPKPWLIVPTQSSRPPHATTFHAYDPRSHAWIEIHRPSLDFVSFLRSSHSGLLYMLSPTKLSFSSDPLHLTWHHADAPRMWRIDPIVALVGSHVVVAGGACDFEGDPFAVEIYDMESRTWDTCNSLPFVLKDSAASAWVSVAVNDRKLFVTEKVSGVTHTFDPQTKTWRGRYDLRPDPAAFSCAIGFADGRMILVALIGEPEHVGGVKLYKINCESFDSEEIGEMPATLVEKLRNENNPVSSIIVSMAGDFVYMSNPSEPEHVVYCELGGGGSGSRSGVGGCVRSWGSVRNWVASDGNGMKRLVYGCSEVGLDDVQRALRINGFRFSMNSADE